MNNVLYNLWLPGSLIFFFLSDCRGWYCKRRSLCSWYRMIYKHVSLAQHRALLSWGIEDEFREKFSFHVLQKWYVQRRLAWVLFLQVSTRSGLHWHNTGCEIKTSASFIGPLEWCFRKREQESRANGKWNRGPD